MTWEWSWCVGRIPGPYLSARCAYRIMKTVNWRLIPTWLPVAVCAITILCNIAAAYATFGGRMADAERRISAIEADRADKQREYELFKTDIRSDVAEIKTDLKWIRSTLERH